MGIRRWKIFFCVLLTAAIWTGHVMGGQKDLGYKGKELCDFAEAAVGLLGNEDRAGLVAKLRSLEKEASPEMQPVIGDLIQVLNKDGLDAFVSDLGRRIKMDVEKLSIYREDLIPITKKLDEKFKVENGNYHQAMIDTRAKKKFAKSLYCYLKISEARSSDRDLSARENFPAQAK